MNINSSYDDGEDDDDELLIPEIVVVPTKVKMATSAALSHAQDSNSWECEHDCGFRDKSIATVEKHELTCASNPASSLYNPIYEDEEDDSDGDLDYIDALEEGNINDALLEGAPSPAGSAPASRRRLRRLTRGNGSADRFTQKEGEDNNLLYSEVETFEGLSLGESISRLGGGDIAAVLGKEHRLRNLEMHPVLDCGIQQQGNVRVVIQQPLSDRCVCCYSLQRYAPPPPTTTPALSAMLTTPV